MLYYVKSDYERSQDERLKKILEHYSDFPFYENRHLASKSLNYQKEIISVVLTYRLSYKNFYRLFQTSPSDLEEIIGNFPDLTNAFYFLRLETTNEKKELEELAFKKAKRYFLRKQELQVILIKAKKEGNKEKQEIIKEKITLLQSEIYDVKALNIQNKDELTEEDALIITDYRIKYYLTRAQCKKIFGISDNILLRFENKLISEDDYYYSKLSFLNQFLMNPSKISNRKKR